MAEEATVTETPATPVETPPPAPANTNTPAAPANDNGQPAAPTEAEFLGWVEKYGPDKALAIVAKKLNMAVDGTTIANADAVKHRHNIREQQRKLEERERAMSEQLAAKIKEHEGDIELGRALKKAKASGDYDGVAKALGEENWEALQNDFIKRLADPNHQRLLELEKQIKQREEQEQTQRQQAEQRAQEQQRQALVQGYKQKMSVDMRASKDPAVAKLAGFPDVVEMLYTVQNDNFDRTTNSTVTLEQAMDLPMPGNRGTPRAILRQWRDALTEAFPADAAAPAGGAPPKAKTKTDAKPPVAPSGDRKASEKEWLDRGARQLEDAIRREEEERRAERLKGNGQARQ